MNPDTALMWCIVLLVGSGYIAIAVVALWGAFMAAIAAYSDIRNVLEGRDG